MRALAFAAALLATPAGAQDIWVLGEVHDNPAHHAVQAERVVRIAPTALVFEMLTPDQAAQVTDALRDDVDVLSAALDWDSSGWPDFSLYYPIFAAAPGARVYGAGVPRAEARKVMEAGLEAAFGGDAAAFGLDAPLPPDQQDAREALQKRAHCDALPAEMLPVMVDIQRLRDARLASTARRAMAETGGPVAVITGNGHARRDWGMPALMARAAPDLEVFALGQGEDGLPPDGLFDEVTDAPAPERDDPCAVFD